MMPLRKFTIHQPKTIAEASQMLAEFGEKGRLYAGGTELLLAMKHDLLRYEHLVDVKTIADLNKIELKNGALDDRQHGDPSRHRAFSDRQAKLAGAGRDGNQSRQCARARQRHAWAAISASPSRTPIRRRCSTALGAKAHVQGKSGAKTVAIDKLITGAYETSLAGDELLGRLSKFHCRQNPSAPLI